MTSYLHVADETLFRDPDLFEADHLPEVFNHRDTQLEALAFALRPALHGARPLNTILQGPPSTGKTTAVRLLFSQVREATTQVVPVLVPCQVEQTAYAVFARIYLALAGHPPPAHGPSGQYILIEAGRILAKREAVLVVCLDDASVLVQQGVLDDVLVRILRLHESCPGARTGVVMTTSSADRGFPSMSLTPSACSSLQARTIVFPPYTAREVRAILADRVQFGVYPGVVPSAALDAVAEETVRYGDLRVGLQIVKEAVLRAERAGRSAVTSGDVRVAAGCVRQTALAVAVQALAQGEEAVLAVLARMAAQGEETTSGLVYEAVSAVTPMSYSTFYERVRRLEEAGLVLTRQQKKGQGRTREIRVADGVAEALAPSLSIPQRMGVAEPDER